jgi:hypothetical protein
VALDLVPVYRGILRLRRRRGDPAEQQSFCGGRPRKVGPLPAEVIGSCHEKRLVS